MRDTEPAVQESGVRWQPWERSWQDALYGPDGFFVSGGRGPRHDFSTSATRGPRLAEALAVLLQRVLHQLDGPGRLDAPDYDVTEIGAGDGRLLSELRAALPPGLANRGRFTAVELGPRPPDLPAEVDWSVDQPGQTRGLLLAHEWLDNVPCPVVELDGEGDARYIDVDRHGQERLGHELTPQDTAWSHRWWPLTEPGSRAEIGRPRDAAWRAATARLTGGLALAVDYAHTRATRPHHGSLTGYRGGREVPPVPDGGSDITAHVALDACAEAGDLLVSQRAALAGLGVGARLPPAPGLAELRRTGEERQLLDPQGAGGFGWLLHPAGQVDVGGLLR